MSCSLVNSKKVWWKIWYLNADQIAKNVTFTQNLATPKSNFLVNALIKDLLRDLKYKEKCFQVTKVSFSHQMGRLFARLELVQYKIYNQN